jgi:hypothetical protein
MKLLASNAALYQYLVELGESLRKLGSPELADIVTSASNQASALSTEFLGESRIALRRVWSRGAAILSDQAYADLLDVLKQLDTALDKR